MYEEHFRFAGSPFRLNPDPKFFFGSRSHNKAMAYLHYGLRQAEGFIVITGEIGAGKSMLIGHLLDQLDRTNVVAAHLLTSSLEPAALLSHVLSAFRIEAAGAGRSAELEAFEDFLFDQMNRGRRVLLIVDEAQNLPARTIEELRMLSNMDYDGTPLFQVFLVGQPEFRGILAKPDMEQFRQRVIATYHLEPLAADETREYILHRLAVVGWSEDPTLAEDAVSAIHTATGGVPRKINSLCNRIFLYCALEKLHAIDAAMVGVVVADLTREAFGPSDSEEAAPARDVEPAKAGREPAEEERRAAGSGRGRVVVPFGARKSGAAETPPATDAPIAPKAPDPQPLAKTVAPSAEQRAPSPAADLSQMSVLDRLRARRALDAEPSGATLRDVADAIAAVSAADAPTAIDDDADGDEDAGAVVAHGKGWRHGVLKAVDETREELKDAHAGASALRRALGDAADRREDRRKRLADIIARAEAALAAARDPQS